MRRVVLDTNCLIAVLPSKSPYHKVWTKFLEGEIEICASTEVLLEYEEILTRKTSAILADNVIKALINKSNFVQIEPQWRFQLIKSDYDDNKFVDCAICGNAEFLVSEDKHFSILEQIEFPKVNLIQLNQFIDKL